MEVDINTVIILLGEFENVPEEENYETLRTCMIDLARNLSTISSHALRVSILSAYGGVSQIFFEKEYSSKYKFFEKLFGSILWD